MNNQDKTDKKLKSSRGRRQVERERLRLAENQRRYSFRDAKHIGKGIEKFLRKIGLEESHWVGSIEERWLDIAGEAVARHTRPGRIQGKKLIIFVDSSVWLGELSRYGRKDLLANLQKIFGSDRIGDVSFQLDPGE